MALVLSWQAEHAATVGESTSVVAAAGVVVPVVASNEKPLPYGTPIVTYGESATSAA
jgi:hypothetical protein